MARSLADDSGDRETMDVGDNHVIVVAPSYRGSAPENHPERRLEYERGDELPRAVGERVGLKHPQTLALIDDDGEVLSPVDEVDRADLHDAIQEWMSGGTFRAPEYEPDDS